MGKTNCFEKCLQESQNIPEINGATLNPTTNHCWCERRMISIDINDQSHRTCIFKELVIPPYYASCTYLPGVGYGLQDSEVTPQPPTTSSGEHCSEICLAKHLVNADVKITF